MNKHHTPEEMVMTDRELLELAAKSVGYDTSHPMNRERLALNPSVDALWISKDGKLVHTGWNPLTNDGDALRLEVKLELLVDVNVGATDAGPSGKLGYIREPHGTDPFAATRRAIVRAAAEIGRKP